MLLTVEATIITLATLIVESNNAVTFPAVERSLHEQMRAFRNGFRRLSNKNLDIRSIRQDRFEATEKGRGNHDVIYAID